VSGGSPQRWTFGADVPEGVRTYLASGDWRRDAVEVKRNRRRVVYRCSPPGGGPALYLKEDVASSLFDWAKTWFRCKAKEEFLALQAIRSAGVASVRPLGWLPTPRGGVLATEELLGRDLRRTITAGVIGGRTEFLEALADFVAGLVRAGVDHPDLHAGNIMVDGELATPTFALLDLYGVRLRPDLDTAGRHRLLFFLVPLLVEVPRLRRERLLRRIPGDAPRKAWAALVRAWGQLRGDKWGGWRRRLLGKSSVCREQVDATGHWLLAGSPDKDGAVREALALYRAGDSARVELLKDDRKRQVARVRVPGGSYIVKEYREVQRRWLWRPDRLGWLNTARARSLSPQVASCRAWVRGSSGVGYLVQEDVGTACLHNYVAATGPAAGERRFWLAALADTLAFLHLCGCFHADLKAANWIVDAASSRLRIVDCDDVRFYRQMPEWARERNLRQLAESCPPHIALRERLRFLVLYGRVAELPPARIRALAGLLSG